MVGGLAVIQCFTLTFAIPKLVLPSENLNGQKMDKLTVKEACRTPSIIVPFLDLFLSYLGYGLINSMLEEYMDEKTKASNFQIGWTFTALGLVYMVASLLSGMVRPENHNNNHRVSENRAAFISRKP